jgi:membrane protein implicated in regulation of membrane protease activity
MTWSDFYLICFLVGLILSAVSFLFGHMHLHIGHGPHFHVGHGHGPHVHGHAAGGHDNGVSFFNVATMTAFLAWFGGAGYLLTRYSSLVIWLALATAGLAGLAGASLIFWFLLKLAATEQPLDPADYYMIGALGKLSANIRAGGTGEMIFPQQGARKAVGARSEDGTAIPKGTEVVITRYEKGIAYVRRWDELAERSE